jgi:hypothetical protein
VSSQQTLEQILTGLTPKRLREIILDLSSKQTADTREGVSVHFIMDAVAQGVNLYDGPEGWEAQLRFKKAIQDAVALIPGMRYMEGDA